MRSSDGEEAKSIQSREVVGTYPATSIGPCVSDTTGHPRNPVSEQMLRTRGWNSLSFSILLSNVVDSLHAYKKFWHLWVCIEVLLSKSPRPYSKVQTDNHPRSTTQVKQDEVQDVLTLNGTQPLTEATRAFLREQLEIMHEESELFKEAMKGRSGN